MLAPPPDDRASFQSYTLASLGLLAAAALVGVSMFMNFRFGQGLGRTELDGDIYGAASIAADAFKCLSPFFFFAAVRNRMWSQASAAALVWLVTTGYALTGAVGHAALNRLDTSAKRAGVSDTYTSLKEDQARIKQQIAWIPQHRPVATVQAEIQAKQTDRLFRASASCGAPVNAAQRTYCTDLRKIEAELGSAVESEKLEAKLAEISSKLAPIGSAPTAADPQATVLSSLTGGRFDVPAVQAALALLVVLLIEVGSGLGPYVAMAYFPDRPTKKRSKVPAANDDMPLAETVPAAQVLKFPVPKQVETAALEAAPVMETVAEELETEPYDDADAIAVLVGKPDFSSFPVRKEEAEPDLRRILAATGGRIPSQKFLRGRWGVAKGTICKWVNSWDWVELEIDGNATVVKEASHRIAA